MPSAIDPKITFGQFHLLSRQAGYPFDAKLALIGRRPKDNHFPPLRTAIRIGGPIDENRTAAPRDKTEEGNVSFIAIRASKMLVARYLVHPDLHTMQTSIAMRLHMRPEKSRGHRTARHID